ncbi:MAG: 23S rRNA pseudouridine1911/1915/1917 synthase [Luteibaculaceae bacterium]|jgi:23S rRNA pseudouridine1911/1915/1917 synthase
MEDQEQLREDNQLYEHFKYEVDKGQELLRVDKFLIDRMPNTSRNRIQAAAKTGNIHVNGEAVKVNYKVKPGDVVALVMSEPMQEIELIPEDIPLDIVYEDDSLMVINKPAGFVVHPGHGNYSGTLVNALIFHCQNLPVSEGNPSSRPGLVHRIDKDTTGLMVIAKTLESMTHLGRQFFDRTIERRYHALVWGNLKDEEGEIEGNIGRSLKDRKVRAVFPDGDQGKHALTRYKVLKRFGYVTLVECKLETGRTHQIRVHFRFIGHPLFGDPVYGGDKVLFGTHHAKYKAFVHNGFKMLPRQALHAKSLGFEHPKTGEKMSFESELAPDMVALIKKWDDYMAHYTQKPQE